MTEVQKALTERINAEHRACGGAARSALEHAIRCGEMLSEVKAGIGHGEWSPWLASNFEGSDRTARTYMRLAAHKDELSNWQRASDLGIRGALQELEPPKKEEPPEGGRGMSEDRLLWNSIALLIEDNPKTFLFDSEIPLIVRRLWRGPEGEADGKLLSDYLEALDSVPEDDTDTDFDLLHNTALVGWRVKRAIGAWITTVVMESGDCELQPQRLRYEADMAELEANPESWEVFWHVTAKEHLRAGSE